MFRITDAKGFHLTFPNGWTISVQFGSGNYSSNYDMPREWNGHSDKHTDVPPSRTAEVAAWHESGSWYSFDTSERLNPDDSPSTEGLGYQTTTQVLALINHIASLEDR